MADNLFEALANKDFPFYLFTNNNSLKVYLSKDSIVCNHQMETENFDKSFSNLLDKGLLITHKKLNSEILGMNLDEFQHTKPIILELAYIKNQTFKIPALLINTEYNIKLGDLREYNYQKDIAAFVIGQIPFCFVSGIFFQNSADMNSFNTPMLNINYPQDLYSVKPEAFNGNESIECQKICDELSNYFSSSDIGSKLMKSVKQRDRIKAMFLSSMFGFMMNLKIYTINFDAVILSTVNEKLRSVIENLRTKDIYLSESDLKKPADPTSYYYLNDILEHILNDADGKEQWIKKLALKSSQVKKEEILGYQIAIDSLLEYDFNKPFDKEEWLHNFEDKYIKTLENFGAAEEVISGYKNQIKVIYDAFDGIIKITDYLNGNKDGSKLINGLMIFLKNSMPNEAENLSKEIKHFKIGAYEERMTWVLYGALNGTASLSGNMKGNSYLNRKSDELSCIITASEMLISDACLIDDYLKYRKPDSDTLLTQHGYPIIANKHIDADICAELLIGHLTAKGKNKTSIRNKINGLLENQIYIPEQYFKYIIKSKCTQYKIVYEDSQLTIESNANASIEREFLKDKYLTEVIQNRNIFKTEFEKQPEKWEKIILEISKYDQK
jgi:hypothetical protein